MARATSRGYGRVRGSSSKGHSGIHNGRRANDHAISIGWSHDTDHTDIKAWSHRSVLAIKPPKKVRTIGAYRWASGALSLTGPVPKPVTQLDCVEYKGRFHKRNGKLCCGNVNVAWDAIA